MSKDCASIIQKLQKHVQDKEQQDVELQKIKALQSYFKGIDSISICPTFFNNDPKEFVDFQLCGVDLGLPEGYAAWGYFSKESRKIVLAVYFDIHDTDSLFEYPVEKADELYFQHISKNFVY